MDITKTVEPKSDQLNYDDVASHPLTVTIVEVKAGPPDQPVELHNAEYPGRPYKPGKSMRRVLIAAWGTEASVYVGRKITLYGDPTIKFGKDAVGGIRIRALSHITEPLTIALTVTRGSRKPFTVQPIAPDEKAESVPEDVILEYLGAIASADSIPALQAVWEAAGKRGATRDKRILAATNERKAALQ
jgi:hypothetical protein